MAEIKNEIFYRRLMGVFLLHAKIRIKARTPIEKSQKDFLGQILRFQVWLRLQEVQKVHFTLEVLTSGANSGIK